MFKTEVMSMGMMKWKHFQVFKCGSDCVICLKRCSASVQCKLGVYMYRPIDLQGGNSIATTQHMMFISVK